MRFASLGSGSGGNATLVQASGTTLLVDCGFSLRETTRRLARLDKSPDAIDAILVTHEHGDHVNGVGPLARKYGIPVWMTPGTHAAHNSGELPRVELFNCHERFAIGGLGVEPFPVPHDAREPCQFVFNDSGRRLGVLTDTGSVTPHITERLKECHALMLECNHDTEMLASGAYPQHLKQRVGGRLGHLSNSQAAVVLAEHGATGLQHIVAMHLSEKNNTPKLARAALSKALNCKQSWIGVATQKEGLAWREII